MPWRPVADAASTVRRVVSLIALLMAAAALVPASAHAAGPCDLYAAPWGSDGAGGSAADPLRTPQALARRLGPGRTGCLRAGTYTGGGHDGFVLDIDRGGRPGAPLTLRSAPGEEATLHGVIAIRRGADDVRLTRLRFNAQRPWDPMRGQPGIAIFAKRTQLTNSRVTSSRARSCVQLGSNTELGDARRTLIRDNVFTNCGNPANRMFDHGIYVLETTGARILDNVFLDSSGFAVQLYPNAQRTLVRGNLMLRNGGGVVFGGDERMASNRNRVVGNVIGESRQTPELTGSFGGPVGYGNVARRNCLVPGRAPADYQPNGYRMGANAIRPAGGCMQAASSSVRRALTVAAPAVARHFR
jgi:hypothetical protein